MKLRAMALTGLVLWSGVCFANQTPKALSTDNRMRVVPYNQNDVVTVIGSQLTSTALQFGDDEMIVGVNGGDAAAWEVDINKNRPNMVFIKPTVDDSDTNLTVLTNKYTYHFHLTMKPDNPLSSLKVAPTYSIRFTYPMEEAKAAMALAQKKAQDANAVLADNQTTPAEWNFDYSFSTKCAVDNVPIQAFDDGHFTYFEFGPNHDNPAIFLVDGQGHEAVANWHMKGKYIVIERTAPQFTIRNNGSQDASCVFNQHYQG